MKKYSILMTLIFANSFVFAQEKVDILDLSQVNLEEQELNPDQLDNQNRGK